MTDEQQSRIANDVIERIEKILSQAKAAGPGEAKFDKLKEIERIINNNTSVQSLPNEWMDFFSPAGVERNATTIAICAWFNNDISGNLNMMCPGTRRVFKNRENGNHAEIEMLEWLSSTTTSCIKRGVELRFVVSRSPCENCLERILAFQKKHGAVNIRIGFASWYHKSSSRCSNLHQMYDSAISMDTNYALLSQTEMEDGTFSPLFGSTLPPAVYPDWKEAMEHAFEDCYRRTEQKNSCLPFLVTADGSFDLFKENTSREFKLDNLRVKIMNKKYVRMAKAVHIMLSVFGVRFAFWKWHDYIKR